MRHREEDPVPSATNVVGRIRVFLRFAPSDPACPRNGGGWQAVGLPRSIAPMSLDPSRLSIVHYPASILKQRAKSIEKIDDTVRAVAQRMIELMNQEQGIGLAAPQVGLSWRMFVTRENAQSTEASRQQGNEEGGIRESRHQGIKGDDAAIPMPCVYINPTLKVNDPDSSSHEEGCLSLPGIHGEILRPKSVTISATGLDGKPFTRTSDQFIARVWQHENDHLNGVLIIDKMAPIERMAHRKALKDLEAAAKIVVVPGRIMPESAPMPREKEWREKAGR